MYTVIVSLLTR